MIILGWWAYQLFSYLFSSYWFIFSKISLHLACNLIWKLISMKLKHYINIKSILLIYLRPYPSKNVKRNSGNDKKVQISTDTTGMFYLTLQRNYSVSGKVRNVLLLHWIMVTIPWGGCYNDHPFTQGTKMVSDLLKMSCLYQASKPQLLGSWVVPLDMLCNCLLASEVRESLHIININSHKEREVQSD